MSRTICISVALFVSFASAALAADQNPPIERFHVVDEGKVYRGAHPSQNGIEYLRTIGVHTIIDLEQETPLIEQERKWADQAGIQFVSVPFETFKLNSEEKFRKVFSTLADPANYPIYVHCTYGRDRTGLIIGLYRVL